MTEPKLVLSDPLPGLVPPKWRIENAPPGHCVWGEAICDDKCLPYSGCKLERQSTDEG